MRKVFFALVFAILFLCFPIAQTVQAQAQQVPVPAVDPSKADPINIDINADYWEERVRKTTEIVENRVNLWETFRSFDVSKLVSPIKQIIDHTVKWVDNILLLIKEGGFDLADILSIPIMGTLTIGNVFNFVHDLFEAKNG